MQIAEMGHFRLSVDGIDFDLVPSLRNMAKLADSKKILRLYEMIHSDRVPDWLRLDIARDVFLCCANSNAIDKYLIRTRRMKPVLNKNKISISDQVVVAASLLRHGIAGVNRPKTAGDSNKKNNSALTEFNINKIVADAQIHFGLSEEEALNLTMSKFYYLLAAKYPPESDTKKADLPSLDEHKAAMKALMEEQNNGK